MFILVIYLIVLVLSCAALLKMRSGDDSKLHVAHRKHKLVISIESNIATGKSTFINFVKQYFDEGEVAVIEEPVGEWENIDGDNMLKTYYSDPKRWGYTFQMMAFMSKAKKLDELYHLTKASVIILERSVHTDNFCFMKNLHDTGTITDIEYNIYKRFHIWLRKKIPKVDGFVYLRSDPEVCFNRMKIRSRQAEGGIIPDYLKQIHQKHEEWFARNTLPRVVINCNDDFEHNKTLLDAHMNKLKDFIDMI